MSNTRRTEGKGINAVEQFVFNSELLVPFLDFNDRTDSWDGNIFVYSDPQNKKEDLVGKVPVQVKSSTVRTFSGESTSISLSVTDLKNYRNDGGIVIFYVECYGQATRLFYIPLLPYDLNEILSDLPDHQKTRNIKLKRLDETDSKELEDVLNDFLLNRKKQFSLEHFIFPEKQIKEILLQGHVPKHITVEEKLLSSPQYLYGKTNVNSVVWDCVTKISVEAIKKSLEKPILLNGKMFFERFTKVETREGFYIIPSGSNVKIEVKGNRLKVNYRLAGTLAKEKNDAEFVFEFVSQMLEAQFDGLVNQDELNDFLDNLRETLEYLNNAAALLDFFGIDHDELELDLSKEEKHLDWLINAVVLNKSVPRPNNIPGIFRFKIGTISLLAYIKESGTLKIQVRDFNDLVESRTTIALDRSTEELSEPLHVDVSPYIMLNSEDLCCANIDLATVMSNVRSFPHGALYDGHVLSLCLEMIKVYDHTQEQAFLDGAEKLVQWINNQYVEEDLLLINALQITRRKRELTMKEMKLLERLKDSYADDIFMLCGISILMGDLSLFKSCFQMLSDFEKGRFSGYPIANLLPKGLLV